MKIDQRSPLLEVGRELCRISGPAEPNSAAIGMEGQRAEITAYQAPIDLDPSPALSLVVKAKPMLGRKVGALVTDGAHGARLEALRDALEKEGAELAIVAPRIGGVRLKSGKDLAAGYDAVGRALCFL
jgi:catalase